MTSYFVDAEGKYLGGFDGAEPPAGAIEVPSAPSHASDTWNGQEFVPATPVVTVPQEVSRRRGLEALFKMYGLKDVDIEAAIANHLTDPGEQYLAMNEFRTSQTFEYERPLVVFMCGALGLDRAALFTLAGSLP